MVVSIGPDKVKLGIEAPGHVPVHRLEISERIEALRVHESE
jgi:carbon storage regulator CsrA